MRSTTSLPASSLRPPQRVSFRKDLGGAKSTASSAVPKVKPVPSTAKKLPIVGTYA